MREIKFRAWDKYLQIMYNLVMCGGLPSNPSIWTGKEWVEATPETVVMQYTGLKDSSGVEIYEGDIVEFDWHRKMNKFIAIIVFSNGMFRPEQFMEPLGSYKFIEIIGNIYENPELLEKK